MCGSASLRLSAVPEVQLNAPVAVRRGRRDVVRPLGQFPGADGASNLYKGLVGSLNLGIVSGKWGVNNDCIAGYELDELVDAVNPGTFTGSVTVKREITSEGCWLGLKTASCPEAVGDC